MDSVFLSKTITSNKTTRWSHERRLCPWLISFRCWSWCRSGLLSFTCWSSTWSCRHYRILRSRSRQCCWSASRTVPRSCSSVSRSCRILNFRHLRTIRFFLSLTFECSTFGCWQSRLFHPIRSITGDTDCMQILCFGNREDNDCLYSPFQSLWHFSIVYILWFSWNGSKSHVVSTVCNGT